MGQHQSGERLGGGREATAPARKRRSVGVTPLKRKTKEVYQIAFSYMGVECREVVPLPHSKANETYCSRLRSEILGKIARNQFAYRDYFPESQRAARFEGAPKPIGKDLKGRLEAYRDRAEHTLEPSTFAPYRRDIDNVLIPTFGHLLPKDLTKAHLRDFVASRAVSLKRLQNQLLPLRNVMNEAVEDGDIDTSPFTGLNLSRLVSPQQRTTDYEPDPYTTDDLVAVLANLSGIERWTFQLWAFTGLRTGELVGLRWNRVDLERNEIQVLETTTVGRDKARPKTPSGRRTVPLLPAARQAIDALRGLTGAGSRVTVNPRGRREDPFWDTNKLAQVWSRAHRGTDVRPRNPYQLRHTWASQLLSQGENLAHIARLLGHKNVEMVTRVYGRWVAEGERLGFDRPPRRYGMDLIACESACESGDGRGRVEDGFPSTLPGRTLEESTV